MNTCNCIHGRKAKLGSQTSCISASWVREEEASSNRLSLRDLEKICWKKRGKKLHRLERRIFNSSIHVEPVPQRSFHSLIDDSTTIYVPPKSYKCNLSSRPREALQKRWNQPVENKLRVMKRRGSVARAV